MNAFDKTSYFDHVIGCHFRNHTIGRAADPPAANAVGGRNFFMNQQEPFYRCQKIHWNLFKSCYHSTLICLGRSISIGKFSFMKWIELIRINVIVYYTCDTSAHRFNKRGNVGRTAKNPISVTHTNMHITLKHIAIIHSNFFSIDTIVCCCFDGVYRNEVAEIICST